jgi:hypothetical protein
MYFKFYLPQYLKDFTQNFWRNFPTLQFAYFKRKTLLMGFAHGRGNNLLKRNHPSALLYTCIQKIVFIRPPLPFSIWKFYLFQSLSLLEIF